MPDPRRAFGNAYERLAATYLEQLGYRVLAWQYQTPFGEIDLVCQDGDELVFVEVKARTNATHGHPEESVHAGKVRKIVKSAYAYMAALPEEPFWRVDVIAVEVGAREELRHLKAVDIPEGIC